MYYFLCTLVYVEYNVFLSVCLSLSLFDYVNKDDDDDDSDAYAFRKSVGMSEAVLKPCWYG